MARGTESFRRPKSRYKPQPTVLVICEDSNSSRIYLEDAAHHFRVDVKVRVSHCGKTDPKGIVEEALSAQKQFDRVYCVIDRDAHHNFFEALELAKSSSKVAVVASYPCYEFWLLLHFGYCRKPYSAVGGKSSGDCLVADLRKKPGMAGYEKKENQPTFAMLLEKLDEARGIAPKVLADAVAEENLNPSTELHLLLDQFEELSEPQPAA